MTKRGPKEYSEEFRREAVRLAEAGTKPLTQIARELGIHLETLRGVAPAGARRVSRECLVSFEGRRYSVPFAAVGRTVEVRGTAAHVVILTEGRELARHARHTAARLVLTPAHYEGASTPTVRAPTPLGRRARLQLGMWPGLPTPATVERPLEAYVTLVEEACR